MRGRVSLVPLSPFGALRALTGTPGSVGGWTSFPDSLATTLSQHDLPDGSLWFAWEISRLSPSLTDRERRAMLLLVLATLIAETGGSTRLPLFTDTTSGEGRYLSGILTRLAVFGDDHEAALATARDLSLGIPPQFAPIVGRPGEHRPLTTSGRYLYQQRMMHHEDRLVLALQKRLAATTESPFPGERLEAILCELQAHPPSIAGGPMTLSREQEDAVRAAVTSPFTVISGGPGTGKTSIVVSILRALVRMGVPIDEVALAAPTGKAANRMDEAIRRSLTSISPRTALDEEILTRCPAPRTLHRLLGATGQGERVREARLTHQVVIVDECSMIDLALMDQLTRAVRDDARLILLGDADQLPSVDAGAVLCDLVPPEGAPDDPRARVARRLTKSYRMDPTGPSGRGVLTVGRHINRGDGEALFLRDEESADRASLVTVRGSAGEITFDKVELLLTSVKGGSGAARRDFLKRWYEDRVRALADFDRLTTKVYTLVEGAFTAVDQSDLARLFAHFDDFRLLCVTRGDGLPTGADAINEAMRRLAQSKVDPPADPEQAGSFGLGAPVMMNRNDYGRGLWNGDQGIILRVADASGSLPNAAPRPRAVFSMNGRSRWGVFVPEALGDDLTLSFAVTVHKGQGSEFSFVGILLPDAPLPIVTRELLYTAVTRSRRSVTFVGEPSILVEGARAKIHRSSGIAERLIEGDTAASSRPPPRLHTVPA